MAEKFLMSDIIRSAEKNGDNYIFGMGDVSFFRGLADDNESFVWNIEKNY